MMIFLPIKKRDPGAPMISSEIGGRTFTRSLLDTRASINILPKELFDRHHVWGVATFPCRIMLSSWIDTETPWHIRRCDCQNRILLFHGRLPSHRYKN